MTADNRADGALDDAIAELRRAKAEDSATIDTHDALDLVLNAVLSGALIPRPAANGWRPIETAPRDGTWFRARTEHGTERVVHFADEADRYPINHDREVWSTAPVEWTPVAPRPAEPAQAAQADWEARRWAVAVGALGAMPEGYCFCSTDRIGDDSKTHGPECADLRALMKRYEDDRI